MKLTEDDEQPVLPKTQSFAPLGSLDLEGKEDDANSAALPKKLSSEKRNNSMVSLPSRGKSTAANRLSVRFKRALADKVEQTQR